MSRFKVGGKCKCIRKGLWFLLSGEAQNPHLHPKQGDVLTVKTYEDGFLSFEECHPEDEYEEKWFIPIEEYTDSLSIAESLVKELGEVDKAKEPLKELA